VRHGGRHGVDPEPARLLAAHHDREGVVEAERLGPLDVEAIAVGVADPVVDLPRVVQRLFAQDHGQRRAGVFDVQVELPRQQPLVTQQRAAEIDPPLDRQSGARLEVLRQQLRQDDLLGEVLGANGDRRRTRAAAAQNDGQREGQETHDTAHR